MKRYLSLVILVGCASFASAAIEFSEAGGGRATSRWLNSAAARSNGAGAITGSGTSSSSGSAASSSSSGPLTISPSIAQLTSPVGSGATGGGGGSGANVNGTGANGTGANGSGGSGAGGAGGSGGSGGTGGGGTGSGGGPLPGAVPEPSTLAIWSLLVGLGLAATRAFRK